jgi:hypothetical protein
MDLDEEIEHYEQRQNFIASRESITLPDLNEDIDTDLTNFDLIDINAEINRSVAEVENMTYETKINLNIDPNSAKINREVFDEMDEYDLDLGDPLYELHINLGSNDIPRLSCACHKAIVAVRMAVKKHESFSTLLAALSKFAARTRASINQSRIHINEKSRLRCENQTRWSSSFLMLESFKKCYDKNIFKDDHVPPASKETIEEYLQILVHAYKFTNILKST